MNLKYTNVSHCKRRSFHRNVWDIIHIEAVYSRKNWSAQHYIDLFLLLFCFVFAWLLEPFVHSYAVHLKKKIWHTVFLKITPSKNSYTNKCTGLVLRLRNTFWRITTEKLCRNTPPWKTLFTLLTKRAPFSITALSKRVASRQKGT